MNTEASVSITEYNTLRITDISGRSSMMDFNALYAGYYPALTLTAAAFIQDMYYAAGTDEKGRPHLFSSLLGHTWAEVNITVKNGLILPEAYGDVISIMGDPSSGLIFLAGSNGYLITLPDCPRCVRARKVRGGRLIKAELADEMIVLTEEDGEGIHRPVYSEAVYRCSWIFAEGYIKKGGIIADLRMPGAGDRQLPRSLSITEDRLEEFFKTCPEETYVFFLCKTGVRADEAAREARERGFSHAYSLGSTEDVEEEIYR